MVPDSVQAVLLVGGAGGSGLYPLTTTGLPRALLPVCNKSLISYSLEMLEHAGLANVFVVVEGSEPTVLIKDHLEQRPGKLQWELVTVDQGSGSAGALRAVASRLRSRDFVLVAGEVVTDCSISGLLAAHRLNGATVTALLGRTRTSPSSDTKPGKTPKAVDYIGLDANQQQLLFHAGSRKKQKPGLHVLLAPIKRAGPMTIRTDLVDVHLYVFNRAAVVAELNASPSMASIREELLPALVQKQFCSPELLCQAEAASAEKPGEANTDSPVHSRQVLEAPDVDWQRFNHSSGAAGSKWPGWCGVVLASSSNYCQSVSSVSDYADVNREVADPVRFERLTGRKVTKHDNFVPAAAKLGTRTTVGPACVVGNNTTLGDKCSIKRSVLGGSCSVGNLCKIVNSVLMDGVTVGDSCDIRNSVICSGCTIQEGATIKDCHVGHGYTVTENADHKDETLSKT